MDINDKKEIVRLISVTDPSKEDLDSIFRLYKKYLDPHIPGYVTGCGCSSDIKNLYHRLMDWFNKNNS